MKNLRTELAVMLLATLWLLTGAHAQITPSADAYTNSADPTTKYGTATLLYVDGATEKAYIQFNLSSIPTGASISQATLKLYVNAVTTAGSFEVYSVNVPWSESAITYSNEPAPGSVIDSGVALTTVDKNQYILIPITSTVQGWVDTPSSNNGIALVAIGTFNASFDSKENTTTSHPAELDIVFAGGGSGITDITTAPSSGLIGGGNSGTLNLSLTNTCSSGQVLEWNGSAWACASLSGGGTITGVTAGTDLAGGGTSGTVTLNLNTSATDARYAQLNAANTFPDSQTINGVVYAGGLTVSGSSVTNSLFATAATVGLTGMVSEGQVGVGPEFRTKLPQANLDVQGNALDTLIGDPGCGTNFSGIGFQNSALANCTNYALIGDNSGNTYLNSAGSAAIHLRNNNTDQMTIADTGITANSNTQQARAMGGWVKAMAYVDENSSGNLAIMSCYNGQATGSTINTPPCGFTLTYPGRALLDFGFQVSDRFISATPVLYNDPYSVTLNICPPTPVQCGSTLTPSQVLVESYITQDQYNQVSSGFYIFVF
jgi:TGF-beta propeptide